MKRFLGITVLILAFSFVAGISYSENPRKTPVVEVVNKSGPAVVNIRTEKVINLKDFEEWGSYGGFFDKFFEEYFGESYSEGTLTTTSLGSGVIVDSRGLVCTNLHVVQKATNILVVLDYGKVMEGEVVIKDFVNDLALIKTDPMEKLPEIDFADPRKIMIGETVVSIGNPFGLENSVTAGVISGIDRAFKHPNCDKYVCRDLLQTDASINLGSSGGALLNLDGELVGINLAVIQKAQNIGFAVKVDKVVTLLQKYLGTKVD